MLKVRLCTFLLVICSHIMATDLHSNKLNQKGEKATAGEVRINFDSKHSDLLAHDEIYDSHNLLHLEEEDSKYSEQGLIRDKKHDKERRGPKIWDQWGKWSACSVSCGVGKIVRWRHCVSGGCSPGEKEAQIKTCTLPSC